MSVFSPLLRQGRFFVRSRGFGAQLIYQSTEKIVLDFIPFKCFNTVNSKSVKPLRENSNLTGPLVQRAAGGAIAVMSA